MRSNFRSFVLLVLGLVAASFVLPARAQLGSSGSIEGTVVDPSGGAVANATVEIQYPVSGYSRTTTTGADGSFHFTNVPFNPYHLVVKAAGFTSYIQDVDVRSTVPVTLQISLKVGGIQESVTVEASGSDLLETESTFHTDVDRHLIERLPLESQSSSVSSLVTLASPGVVADSNGLFHGLGDHGENSFSIDGQPVGDQQSKVFSNQIVPVEAIQSLEAISGAPPAEYGDKTSLVINVTTRSGLAQKPPVGSIKASYGSFGSVSGGFDVAFGGAKWGDFIAVNGLNTGRFLDPPEFQVLHAKGNEESVFDRVDFQLRQPDTIHMNLGYTRSWFQTPNSFDSQAVPFSTQAGTQIFTQDQRSKINTYNVAPTWTHLFSPTTLFTLGAFFRQDQFTYYPSPNVFADQPQTVNQQRRLTNAGARSDLSYVKGMHNVKVGITYQHTFLTEAFNFGITSPTFNSPCVDNAGAPVNDTALNDPSQCVGAGFPPNGAFNPLLGCFDLSRPTPSANDGCAGKTSSEFPFRGRSDIKETALYVQDTITKGNWSFSVGIRGDLYHGIVIDDQIEPRAGIAYNIKKTNTVLRVSYARTMETPFNENLILASTANGNPVISAVIGPSIPAPIRPGHRNEFHTGIQQAFGKYLVVDADYLWKYTRNGYDFSVFGNTPIFFPIAWHNSKINGASARISLPNYHGLTAFAVLGHVSARFFPPQVGGLGTTVSSGGEVFRIDHDQAFQQTTHVEYQPWKNLPWIAFDWRYDSGLVASSGLVRDFPTALASLDADQQAAIGLFCGNLVATLTQPLTPDLCGLNPGETPLTPVGAQRLKIPPLGAFDVDHNPTRVKARHLFDASIGDDNLFRSDHYKWSLRFTVINLANKVALYNFLSTFSGTHFVTPRTYTGELGFHF